MTEKRTRKPKAKAAPKPPSAADLYKPNRLAPMRIYSGFTHDENAREVAKQILAPELAAYRVIGAAEGNTNTGGQMDGAGMLAELRSIQKAVNAGDLSTAEAMLISQAVSLQTLSMRMIERATAQEWMPQFETYMRLGLKAQRQSCLTIEALGALKHGPAIMARLAQVNVAHGPQQVNNAPPAPALPTPDPAAAAAVITGEKLGEPAPLLAAPVTDKTEKI